MSPIEENGRHGWFVRRMSRRVVAGTLIGAAVGTALGVLTGLLIFQPGSRAVWGTTLAGLVFGPRRAGVHARRALVNRQHLGAFTLTTPTRSRV